MKNDKKTEDGENNSALDWATPESMLEKWVELITNWVSACVGLGLLILSLPLFVVVDIYRWFKFKVLRKDT